MQVILTAKDATSLPLSTVRSASATSMHEVEKSTLSWADTSQWAINRSSVSLVAMVNYIKTIRSRGHASILMKGHVHMMQAVDSINMFVAFVFSMDVI